MLHVGPASGDVRVPGTHQGRASTRWTAADIIRVHDIWRSWTCAAAGTGIADGQQGLHRARIRSLTLSYVLPYRQVRTPANYMAYFAEID